MERPDLLIGYPERIGNVRYFHQRDPRWAGQPYTVRDDPEQTIASSGCMPAWQAMLVATLAGIEVNPQSMAEFNIDRNFRTQDNGTQHQALFAMKHFARNKVLETVPINAAEIGTALELGGLVTVSARLPEAAPDTLPGTRTGHVYGIRQMRGEHVWVSDPDSYQKSIVPHNFFDLAPTFNRLYATFVSP